MRVALYTGPHNIVIKDLIEPTVKPNHVLVHFKAGSICGTDMHFYRGDWKWLKKGRIIGHDACGVREDTGERVVMVPIVNCGHCYFCLRGFPTYCIKGKFYGLTRHGFFAEKKAILPRSLVPLPTNVSDEEAANVEPVALALRVLNHLQPNINDWVTIIGQGAIGLLMTQMAKLKGCRVIAIDKLEYRLELAKKYGAEAIINIQNEDPIKAIRKLTSHGSDLVIEAAGTKETVEQTTFLVKKTGKVALIGGTKGYLNLENADEASFFTMYISPIEYPTAVELISKGVVDVKRLITHRFEFGDFEKAIKSFADPEQKAIRVVLSQK